MKKISLIVSTYNWKEALELTLLSVLNLTVLPDEVIIADDGSTNDTKELIDIYREKMPIPLIHVWHEDKGFRLAEIRNRAIKVAQGNFICQIDGDIILHPKFIEDYKKIIEPGYYYRGSRVKLSKELSQKLITNKQVEIPFFTKGIENRFNSFRNPILHKIMSKPKKEYINALGCNMGFWKSDLIEINGYSNNLVGWGHEDEELCVRLINLGVQKKRIKHKAIAYHIYHKVQEPGVGDEHFEIIEKLANNGGVKTANGLNELNK
jgi:glycosyltransferase involved in cell wall biosynthesis